MLYIVGKHISFKDIPSKTGGPLKEEDMLEVQEGKQLYAYDDVVSA